MDLSGERHKPIGYDIDGNLRCGDGSLFRSGADRQPEVYAVDLDGTLAHHDPDQPFDPEHIGEPVKAMRRLVRLWKRRGIQVVILTARASTQKNIKVVKQWLKEHGMEGLEVTNVKSPSFTRIYDDRAVQVEQNTGRLIKEAGFRKPENFEVIKSLSTKDYAIEAGANDWEASWSGATAQFPGSSQRVWIELESLEDEAQKQVGEKTVKKWVSKACHAHGWDSGGMSWLEAFEQAAKDLKQEELILAYGTDKQVWQEQKRAAVTTPSENFSQGVDPQWTGPAAIEHALKHLDLQGIEDDANEVLRRKLKSKRPAAVERLGFLDGLKKTGIQPHELMVSRVPVIPPMFRPYSMAGNTFVPGDANELYRDLINLIGTHKKLEAKLGATFSGENRLRVYDAVRAVYGHGEPVVPKTAERGVSGFLKQITGVSPKFCYSIDTEILTESGWKYFAEAGGTDRVLTYNSQRRTYEWELPTAWTNYEQREGHLVRIETLEGDLLVTPGHTMWVRQSGLWVRTLAAEMVYNHTHHPHELEGAPNLLAGPGLASRLVPVRGARFDNYVGRVYCCSTRNGLLVVRRKGFVTISGNSFLQRKLVSHDQDFTGRATATLNPELSLDEVGIPDEMAWKLYAPYIQRRLVRGGMRPEEALQHITDRSSYANKQLDLEMQERPIMYSRAPAWHKFNTLGGWARRHGGSSVEVNSMIGTGQNLDHDGNCVVGESRLLLKLETGSANLAELMKNNSTKILTQLPDTTLVELPINLVPRDKQPYGKDKNGASLYHVPKGVSVLSYLPDGKGSRFSEVSGVTVEAGCRLVKVTTARGQTVTCSDNESLVVFDVSTGLKKMRPEEALGQVVAVVKQIPAPSNPTLTDPELGWFLGMFLSDGWSAQKERHSLAFTKADPRIRARLARYLTNRFGAAKLREQCVTHEAETNAGISGESHKLLWHATSTAPDYQQAAKEFHDWLVHHCYDPSLQQTHFKGRDVRPALLKKFPAAAIWDSSREFCLGLLSGLLDGDGTICHQTAQQRSDGRSTLTVAFSTSAPGLRDGLRQLGKRLGIHMSCSITHPKKGRVQKWPGFQMNLSLADMQRLVPDLICTGYQAELECLGKWELKKANNDMLPLPAEALTAVKAHWKSVSVELNKGVWQTLQMKAKYKPTRLVSRIWLAANLKRLPPELRDTPVWQLLQRLVEDTTVTWDVVDTVEEVPTELVYDLMVADTKVFAVNDGLIVQDTLNVHVVSTPDAVRDVKDKLMPSRMLFSLKERDSVVPVPKHEYLLGIHGAQTLPSQAKHTFPDQASALAAIKSGQVKLTDEVEIGSPTP